MRRDGRLLPLWVVLGLAALTVVSLWPLPIQPDRLVMPTQGVFSDLAITHWPMQGLMREAVLQYGEWPFWHPTYFSGQPLAGNPLAGLFYPPNWLHLLLPSTAAFAALIVLHVWWAAVGMFRLAHRGLGIAPAGAVAAAVIFAFGPRLAAHLGAGHVSIVYACAWLPWAILAAVEAESFRDGWQAGILMGLTFLADARMGYYAGLAAGLVLCARAAADARAKRPAWARRWFAVLGSAHVAAAGSAAVLLLPLFELLAHSTRAGLSAQEAAAFSLPVGALLGILLPAHPATHEWVTYLGVPACALAFLAIGSRRRTLVRASSIGFFAAIIVALGVHTPLYGLLLKVVPGLGWLRAPARFWILALACFSLLAGLGVEALAEMLGKDKAAAGRWIAGLLAVVFVLFGSAALFWGGDPAPYIRAGLIGAASLLVVALALWEKMPARWASVALLVCLFADGTSVGRSWWQLSSVEEVLEPGREVAAYLAALPDAGRVYSPSYSIAQQTAWHDGLETAHGVDPMQIERYREFMALAGGYQDAEYSVVIPPFPQDEPLATAFAASRPDASLLGMLNVRYLAAEFPVSADGWDLAVRLGTTYVYENIRAAPRAWLAHSVEVVEGGDAAVLEAAAALDAGRRAVVEAPLPGPAYPPQGQAAESANIVRRTPNSLELEVQSAAPALLVLGEIWYPGWRAWVDGQRVDVLRTNSVLRGVYLAQSGQHAVRLAYVPVPVYVGAGLSALAFLAFALMKFTGGKQ